MKNYWALSNINLYSILCPTKLKTYDKEQGNAFAKEDVIYAEPEKDQNVYLVSKGKVKLVKYDAKIYKLIGIKMRKIERRLELLVGKVKSFYNCLATNIFSINFRSVNYFYFWVEAK